jgi:hypothetical protein
MKAVFSTRNFFERDMVVVAGIWYDSGSVICCTGNLVPASWWMLEMFEVKVLHFAAHNETAAREILQAQRRDDSSFFPQMS